MKLSSDDVLKRYKDEELPEFSEVILENVNQRGIFGNLPIHVAAVRGELDEIEALISGGADINATGERGNSPLHESAIQGHRNAVELLLRSGANPTARNDDKRTAREIAEHLGNSEVVALLDNWEDSSKRGH